MATPPAAHPCAPAAEILYHVGDELDRPQEESAADEARQKVDPFTTYLGMMPEWIPWPTGVNVVSGIFEIAGGIGLMFPWIRKASGWGLIALLVAVFRANLHVALQGYMPGSSFTPTVLWLRLPLQGVLIAWVAWVAFHQDPTHKLKKQRPSGAEPP